jgi:hypothetical protein
VLFIIGLAARVPRRCGPLSSNVRQHTTAARGHQFKKSSSLSTRRTLIALALAYAFVGAAAGYLYIVPKHERVVDLVLNVVTVIAIYSWCRSDLLRRSPVPTGRWALWAALLSPLVLPLHFFRTRPPAAAIKSVAKAVGGYIALTVVFVAFASVAGIAGAA